MQATTVPEILRCNLAGVILSLKAIGIADVSKVDFIDRPEQRSFLAAFQTLIKLGAVDPQTASLTPFGEEMAVLPTDPVYSRLLVTALKPEFKSVRDSIAAIVAMLSVENVYYDTKTDGDKQKQKAIKRRKHLQNQSSDHLALLNVYQALDSLKTNTEKHNFCHEHLLNIKSLQKAVLIKDQLVEYMDQILIKRHKKQESEKKQKTVPTPADEESKNCLVVSCLLEGMPLNASTLSHGNTYKTDTGGEECSIHPSSVLFGRNLAQKNSNNPS